MLFQLGIFKGVCTIWVRRYIWAWLQLAGLFPNSIACWDMVVTAPVELEFWFRPISCAVTGDAGKAICIQHSMIIKNRIETEFCTESRSRWWAWHRYSLSFGKHQQADESDCCWMMKVTVSDRLRPAMDLESRHTPCSSWWHDPQDIHHLTCCMVATLCRWGLCWDMAAVCSMRCCCWAAYIWCRYWAAMLWGLWMACWITYCTTSCRHINNQLWSTFYLWFESHSKHCFWIISCWSLK